MDKEKIYIRLENKFTVDVDTSVYLKDIGEVYATNEIIKSQMENLIIHKGAREEDWDYITNIEVVQKILEYYSNLDVEIFGADMVVLEIKSKEKENKLFEIAKIIFVCSILFFGAGIAIMNFHEDVNMIKSLEKVYFTFTGKKDSNPLIMSIPYSIGLGVGVITFFNRVISSSKRRSSEPGPMEVELYLFDKELEEHILNHMKNKKQ